MKNKLKNITLIYDESRADDCPLCIEAAWQKEAPLLLSERETLALYRFLKKVAKKRNW